MSKTFLRKLLEWNTTNERQMPWKGEKNPYYIWLSEIILQQTRVEQGLKYYEKFILHYPNIEALAAATENEVFKDWEGLGYYSRARNLHHTAKFVVTTYNGQFPTEYSAILQLKGIGPYTAAAIASFAYHLPYAVVDGNVIRVLSRFLGIEEAFDSTEGKKKFEKIAQDFLDKKDPATYNQAIMDFGATVCKPIAPLCDECPLQSSCFAYSKGIMHLLPYKSKKIIKKQRFFNYLIFVSEAEMLIRKRHAKDIWRGLHDFVLIEEVALLSRTALQKHSSYKALEKNFSGNIRSSYFDHHQVLTHQKINARFFIIECEQLPIINDYFSVKRKKIGNFAFPKLINFFLEEDFISFK